VEALEDKLEEARTRVTELEAERKLDRARIEELEGELERAIANPQGGEGAMAPDEPDKVSAVPSAAELARVETPAEPGSGPVAGGVSWQPTAKRALSASLARESVWRNVLKETVEVLGSEGGWDTVTA
jgi:hypothetical protein